MKKLNILFLFVLLAGSTLYAQNETRKLIIDTLQRSGTHDVGWIRSHSFDNWIIDLQGSGHLYYGFEDRKGPLKDRITGNAEVHLGHWIFPMVGIRAGLGMGNSHGFITKNSYLANRGALTADYGNCWGPSTATLISGNDTIRGALGGYYWPIDNNTDLFIQKWKYIYAGLDFMVNLSYMHSFREVIFDKKWNHIVYVGFNVRVGLSENNPEKFSNFIGYSTSPAFKGFKNTNFAAEGHIGYNCQYALTKHINLFAGARLSLLEGNFDRERIPGVETMGPDWEFMVTAGIGYDFNFRSEKQRRNYYVEHNIIPYNAVELPKHVRFVQQEDLLVVKHTEVELITYYDTIDDSVSIRQLDTIFSWLDTIPQFTPHDSVPSDESLDSILLKRMLPYEMVFFDLDKWDIRPQEEMKIAKMARLMKAYPERTFILYGSADSKTGTVKRNDFLSKNRADQVYNRLIIEYGIKPEQMRRVYLGGILDYDPFILNRTTVIIMDHPAVEKAFNEMKAQRRAGGNVVEF